MPHQVSPEFETAAKQARQLTKKPTQDELLELYANFKQASQNPSFEGAEKPGMFDIQGKYKYNAWKKLVDEGVSPADAEKKYIELVEKHKVTYEFDPNKTS